VQTLCIAEAAAALAVAVAAAVDNEAAERKVCEAISATADLPLIETAAVALVTISPPCDEHEGSLRTEQDEPVTIEIVGIAPDPSVLSCWFAIHGTCPGTVSMLALGLPC